MVSRATHFRNKAKHAQREFGVSKPRLMGRDEGTRWMGPYVATLPNGADFNVDSTLALPLSDDRRERELKLRELSKLGVLHMYAHRPDGVFVEYRWRVTKIA